MAVELSVSFETWSVIGWSHHVWNWPVWIVNAHMYGAFWVMCNDELWTQVTDSNFHNFSEATDSWGLPLGPRKKTVKESCPKIQSTAPSTLTPNQNGCHFGDNFFKYIFLKKEIVPWLRDLTEFCFLSWLIINQHWFKVMAWCQTGNRPFCHISSISLGFSIWWLIQY